jgi:hypothetical protein
MTETNRGSAEQGIRKPEFVIFDCSTYGFAVKIFPAEKKLIRVINDVETVIPKGTMIGIMAFPPESEDKSSPEDLLATIRGMKSFTTFLDTRSENFTKYPFPKYLVATTSSGIAKLSERAGFSTQQNRDGSFEIAGEAKDISADFKDFLYYRPEIEEKLLERSMEIDPEFWSEAPQQEGRILIPMFEQKNPKFAVLPLLAVGGIETSLTISSALNHNVTSAVLNGLSTGAAFGFVALFDSIQKKRNKCLKVDWKLNIPSTNSLEE